MAEPAFRPLLAPIPGLSPPVCKGHDPDFGVIVREDNAVGEALEDQPPVRSIADPAGQLVRRFENSLETLSCELEKLTAKTFAAFLVPVHRAGQLRLGTRQQVKRSRHRWAKRARRRPYASFHGTGGSAPESAAATRASHSSSQAWVQSSPGPSSTLASSLEANSSRASGGSASAASNSFSGAIWDTRSVAAWLRHRHGRSFLDDRDAGGPIKRGNPEETTSRFLLAIPLTRPGEGSREYTRPRRSRPF